MFPPEPQGQSSLAGFLTELARLLMSAGVAAGDVENLLKDCFVRAASESARLRNARVNQSAIAAMTGLTRPQVRDCLHRPSPPAAGSDVAAATVLGWISDPDFGDEIPLAGKSGSFRQLAGRYGSKLTPRSLLAELVRRGLVDQVGETLRLRTRSAALHLERQQMERLLAALAQLLRPMQPQGRYPRLNVTVREVQVPDIGAVSRTLLCKRLRQSTTAFIDEIDAMVSALPAVRRGGLRKKNKSKVSVIVVSQE